MRKLRIFNFSLYTRSRRPSMRKFTLNPACRKAELKDVYLALSKYVRHHAARNGQFRAKHQSRSFSRSSPLSNTSQAGLKSKDTFDAYRRQLARTFPDRLNPFTQVLADQKTLLEKGVKDVERKATLYGYIGTTRTANKKVKFADLVDEYIRNACQLTFLKGLTEDGFEEDIPEGSPVIVRGFLQERPSKTSQASHNVTVPMFGLVNRDPGYEFVVESITPCNTFPEDIIVSSETNVPPEQRHLQIRTNPELRNALRTRSKMLALCRQELIAQGFDEIETPLLFKSTPEGAREFLVPTREKGMAYALPQSPQQYKQLLMSSGIPRYFQFAKCFRDEDMRADRQPEFTQLDIEISFADRHAVMAIIERLIRKIWLAVDRPVEKVQLTLADGSVKQLPKFTCLTYQECMSRWGSDKPDLRYQQFPIQQSHQKSLPGSFVGMMTSLEDPVVDFIKLNEPFNSTNVKEFLDSPAATPYHTNPAGPPAVLVVDTAKPLYGLSAFGHAFAESFMDEAEVEPGDLLVFQAREDEPFYGGSTALGDLRRDLIKFGLEKGFLERAKEDVLGWVVDFPLFKPSKNDASDPGQGGHAGIQATHHPFTAPKTVKDFDIMLEDPLQTTGDHYDLVINGVEVGGGSKRIHDSVVQEHVFRDILKMSPERIEDFRHLLEALRVGCPPHSGIALGFDRLMTIICDKESVRDVIAFPKWGAAGEDKLVKSPSKMTEQQLKTYHLSVQD